MILIPLNEQFYYKPSSVQSDAENFLQMCASRAGLAGTVVLIWPTPSGDIQFMAPTPWQSFIKGININWVMRQVNKTLTCH